MTPRIGGSNILEWQMYNWPIYSADSVNKELGKAINFYNNAQNTHDYNEAYIEFDNMSKSGDSKAMYCLGVCYMTGRGVNCNLQQAILTWQNAFPNDYAQFALGVCYQKGWGVRINSAKANELYKLASWEDNEFAKSALKGVHIAEVTVEPREQQNIEKEEAEVKPQLTPSIAFNELSQPVSSVSLKPRCFADIEHAAESGDGSAENELGLAFYNGKGVQYDHYQAVFWFKSAVEQGVVDAMNNLANCYETGPKTIQDRKQAFIMYRRAAELGHLKAQYNIGRCYRDGIGTVQDFAEANHWFGMAAFKGHKKAAEAVRAMEKIAPTPSAVVRQADPELSLQSEKLELVGFAAPASTYFKRFGENTAATPIILEESDIGSSGKITQFQRYEKIANDGNADARYFLGDCYLNGIGVSENHELAFEQYSLAAAEGHLLATRQLAACYQKGEGTAVNLEKGFQLYLDIATRGDVVSERRLGDCYSKGLGTKVDYEEAVFWYDKAAERNDIKAKEELEYLRDKVTAIHPVPIISERFTLSQSNEVVTRSILQTISVEPSDNLEILPDWSDELQLCFEEAIAENADAEFDLGNYYCNGWEVFKNYGKAIRWYARAAANGHREAMRSLALRYAMAQGVPRDLSKAEELYEQADSLPEDIAAKKTDSVEINE